MKPYSNKTARAKGRFTEHRLVLAALLRDPAYRAEKQEVARRERAGKREARAVEAAERAAARLHASRLARKGVAAEPAGDATEGRKLA